MKNRRVIVRLLLGIFALAAVEVLLSFDFSGRRTSARRATLLDVADDTVSLVQISRPGDAETVLSRAGHWRLIEPFSADVDREKVFRFLDSLSCTPIDDSLTEAELLRLGRTRTDFGLAEPRLKVNVRSHVNETEISFGTATPSGKGVYAAIGGIPAVFVVPSNILASVDVAASDFRSRSLFSIRGDSVSGLDMKRGGKTYLRLRREGGAWMMEQSGSAARGSIVDGLLDQVTAAQARKFVWPVGSSNEVAQASTALFSGYGLEGESAVVLTLKCVDGADRRIIFGSEAEDGGVYALVHDGSAIVTVDRSLKDKASSDIDLFSDQRLFPFEISKSAVISVSDGGVTCLLARRDDKTWRMDAPVAADASQSAVDSLLAAMREARTENLDPDGVEIRVADVSEPVKISRSLLGRDFRLENFRSLEVLSIDPSAVKRISVFRSDTGAVTSVVRDRELMVWNVEQSGVFGAVSQTGVERILAAVSPMTAQSVEKLKVSADDIRDCALDEPRFRIALDFDGEGSIRRNILIGKRLPEGGFYATVGSSEAIFILPESVIAELTVKLVEE